MYFSEFISKFNDAILSERQHAINNDVCVTLSTSRHVEPNIFNCACAHKNRVYVNPEICQTYLLDVLISVGYMCMYICKLFCVHIVFKKEPMCVYCV